MPSFYGRVGVQFDGDDILENLDMLATKLIPAARKATEAAGEIVRARAYELANVSEGVQGHGVNGEHMRDEIKVETYEYPDGVSSRIGVDMSIIPYAAHQEFGPRGKPFLRPAIDETRDEVKEVMRASLKEDLIDARFARLKVRMRRFA